MKERRLICQEHMSMMDNDRFSKAVFYYSVEEQRRRGNPRTRCRDNVHIDMDTMGLTPGK